MCWVKLSSVWVRRVGSGMKKEHGVPCIAWCAMVSSREGDKEVWQEIKQDERHDKGCYYG